MVNTDTALNTPAVILSQDAIQEFRVQSETYSAEYGFSANQINIVSKSGTNKLHGSVFEFARNDAFDASTHFQPVKPELRQNQFGFVAGGPVIIPKLYDGRDKTFWLANYEGWRIRNGTSSYYNIPSAAELGGDFSASGLPAFGTAGCTAALAGSNPCMPIDPTTGAPFPGNVIPSTRFSRLANVTAKLFPAQNCFGAGCLGNFHLSTTLPNDTDQQTYRLDQNFGKFGSIFFRYTKANYLLDTASIDLGSRGLEYLHGELDELGDLAHHFAAAWLCEQLPLRISGREGDAGRQPGTDYRRHRPWIDRRIHGAARLCAWISQYFVQNLSGAAGSPGNNPTTSDIPMWEFADSLSTVKGKHTFSMGFDYRTWVQKRDLSTNFLGSYGFNNTSISNNTRRLSHSVLRHWKCGGGLPAGLLCRRIDLSARSFQQTKHRRRRAI